MSDSRSFISTHPPTGTFRFYDLHMTTDTNMQTESSYIYQNIQDVLVEYQETGDVDWMPVSCLEARYNEKYNRLLDYNSLGVESIEELLTKMDDECMVSLYTDPERKEKYVKYESSYNKQKIQDMLVEYEETVDVDGIGMPVSCLETTFQEKYKISLNYNSLGVESIEELLTKMCDEGMVSLYTDPERKEKFVKYLPSESDMQTECSYIKQKIQDLLVEHEETDGMPVSWLEAAFEEKYKISLNYNSLGVKTVTELLVKMGDEGMVCLYTDPESNELYVKYIEDMPSESSDIEDMPSESSDMDVYQQILSILGVCTMGTTLHWLEYRYLYKYGKAPDYDSVGVKDIKDLIDNMRDEKKVLVLEEPEERKETYVMCASYAAQTLWKFLKRDVVKLLEKNGGKIPYSCFERKFKEFFKMELIYPHFGFTSLDNLCQVLNLGLEEADSKGEKVITPPCKFYVRKKKRNG